MLVISIRNGESIRIGEDIVINILTDHHFRGTRRSRLGIVAPQAVKIQKEDHIITREELEECTQHKQ